MTDLQHHTYHVTARAIARAARHVARGESPAPVLAVAPSDARQWVRNHPAIFDCLITQERALIASAREAF